MGLKKTYLILILFCIALVSNAQPKEGNIWCFGTNAGLDFNSGSPLSFTSSISTGEGCASISNEHGNLLFYTDGSSIYNKNHVLMNNGAGLFGSSTSTQSGIIVPNPSGSSIYYVFSTSGIGSLMYSIVDTSLSGGLGYVTSKNNSLMPSGCEKLNGVGHSNGRDTWVVSHQRNNNNFYAYLVTSSGVDTSAVISSVGSTFSGIALGYLKFSPDGKKIVTAQYFGGNDAVEIFDFDTVALGSKVEHTFTFVNTGKTPLLINSVKAGCGCTVLKGWPKKPINPGETGEIPVVLSTSKTGFIKKYISILANTRPATNRLYLQGFVAGI